MLGETSDGGLMVSTTNPDGPGNPATWSWRPPLPSCPPSLLPHHLLECSLCKYASSTSGLCMCKRPSAFNSCILSFDPQGRHSLPIPNPIPGTLPPRRSPPAPPTSHSLQPATVAPSPSGDRSTPAPERCLQFSASLYLPTLLKQIFLKFPIT